MPSDTPAARMRERAAKVADEVAEGERALMPPTATERVAMLVHGTGLAVAVEIAAAIRALPDENEPAPHDVEIAALRADLAALQEPAGKVRACVACGKTVDATRFKRGDVVPECRDEDGMAACTLDMTPQEAWEYWRAKWHEQQAEVARLRKFAIAAGNVLDQCTGDCVVSADILPCDVLCAFIEEVAPGGEWKDARASLEEPRHD